MADLETSVAPKDYHVTEITITSLKGVSLDIKELIVELNIHEDLFNNTTYGTLVVLDSMNRVSNLPIAGFETLVIDFETPNKPNYRKTFRIYGVSDKGIGTEKSMLYILKFTSQEQVTNSATKVQKSYNGKQISEIVNDIHVNYLHSDQNITLEATKYMHSIVIPNWNPFRAINWLAVRANSAFYNGANYFYYENKLGFNFQSVENMIKNNVSGYNFIDQPLNVRLPIDSDDPHKERDYASDFITVESFKFLEHIEVLENIDKGMYGNTLLAFDLLQKDWNKTTYSYKEKWNDMIHMEQNKVSDGNTFLLSNKSSTSFSDSVIKLYPTCPLIDFPNKVEEWILKRTSQVQELHNVRVHITVPGNSDLTVGQTAKFTMYSPEPAQDKSQPLDPYYSGNYLISSVRHSIASKKYVTILELIKDSLFNALP